MDSEVAKVSAAKAVENIIRDLRVGVQQWQQQQQSTDANTEAADALDWETRVNTSASECRILGCGINFMRFMETWRRLNEPSFASLFEPAILRGRGFELGFVRHGSTMRSMYRALRTNRIATFATNPSS